MTDHAKIRSYVDDNASRFLDSLKEAVSIPSVSTEGAGFKEMASWLEDRLVGLGAEVQRLSVNGSPDALLGTIRGASDRTLMIYDHYDVQPVDPIELWESPPFEPTERDGRLYGRGATDNKGDLMARLAAIETYRETVGELPFTIKFFVEGEEESGSFNFEDICHAYSSELASEACVWEGGWFDLDDHPQMYYGCKGLLYVELRCKVLRGDQHSSIAVYTPSAPWRLLQAIASIKDADENIVVEGLRDGISQPGDREQQLISAMPFNEEAVKQSLGIDSFLKGLTGEAFKTEMLYEPTANIAGFHTGYGVPGASKTVLPADAMAKMDFRLVPDQDADEVAKRLREHLDANGFSDVELEVLSRENPSRSPMDTPLAKAVESAADGWFPKSKVVYPFMWATGPMYPIAQGLGIPICSPPGVGRPDSNLHAPNEHCRIADYLNIVGFTVAYLEEFGLSVP